MLALIIVGAARDILKEREEILEIKIPEVFTCTIYPDGGYCYDEMENSEIIGNRFENPELLTSNN